MILEENDIEDYLRNVDTDKLAIMLVDACRTWKEVGTLIDAIRALLPEEATP